MDNYFEDLEPFIEERLGTSIKLKNYEYVSIAYNKFSEKYDMLFNSLNDNNKRALEELYGLLNNVYAKENYIAYQIGFVDGIQLNDYIKKNRN